MFQADTKKREMTHDGENRTTKTRKNQNVQKKETYKYLKTLEADTIKQKRNERKIIKKEYLRRTRKLLEIKLYCGNLNKGINTRVVSLVRYSEPFVKWMREELQQMNLRTRKLILEMT